ncbi:MAG: T9SS type A sorting domain-containing protein [Bacteroidetes bacterium]|nr:T9SS type A sorting domain-containing protein [Bacteroidota bacterium]
MIIGSSNGTKSGDMHDSSFSHILINNFRYDNWIIKIDSAGNKIWDKRYGCWTADDYHTGASLLNTDGDVVIGALLGEYSGPMGSYPCNDGVADTIARGIDDAWIYKIDTADGHIVNERRFGGDKGEAIIQIKELTDKGYIIALKTNSNAGFEKSENRIGFNQQNVNNYDIWLVRMDSAFNIIWDKTLGTDAYDWGPNVIPLNDSTFIVSAIIEKGNSFDVGLPMFDTVAFGTGWLRGDIWVSKWYIPNPAKVQEMSLASFNLHPNPVKDILYITLQNAKNKTYHLHVQDMQGRTVVQRQLTITNSNTIMLESHDWQPGVYVVNIEGVSKKVVKL